MACSLGAQTGCLEEADHVGIELRITIQYDVAEWTGFGESLAQLLDDPFGRRMRRDVEMQDPPSPVLDDEEAVEQLERGRRHGEEVEGGDRLAVVREEGQPTLTGITATLDPFQVPSHGSFRDHEPQLLEFAVDLRRAPVGVLFGEAANEPADFDRHFRPASARP